jgi:Predicted thioesterase
MEDIKFKNRLPIQLRFNDIDLIGHVNNSVYFNFFDLGKTAYFDQVMGKHVDWANADVVIRHIDADFQSPTFYRENIEVDTAVVKIGNKSFHMVQKIINSDTCVVKCVCSTVMVGFDTETNQSKEVPGVWKDAIRKYEENPDL